MAAGITGYDTPDFYLWRRLKGYIWQKGQLSEDWPKDFAEMVKTIHNAFAKINEDQDEINRTCNRCLQQRVNLSNDHQGGHFEKFMTGQC